MTKNRTGRSISWAAFVLLMLTPAAASAASNTSEYQDNGNHSGSRSGHGAIVLSAAGIADSKLESDSQNKQVGLGFGALVEFEAVPTLGLETGLLLVNRLYEVNDRSARLIEETRRLQVPLMARFWPASFFSVGAGPFVSFKAGSTTGAGSAGAAANQLATTASRTAEFGLEAATTLDFPVYKKTGLFIEARLSDTLGRPADENSMDVIGLAGLKFDIGA